MNVVKMIEGLGSGSGKPSKSVKVASCGECWLIES